MNNEWIASATRLDLNSRTCRNCDPSSDGVESSGKEPELNTPMNCYSVVNVSQHKGACVYVGRACFGRRGHPLRNPIKLPKNATEEQRAACIAEYREELLSRPDLAEQLEALRVATRNGQLPLGCWCSPKACHADVLAELLANLVADQVPVTG